MQTETSIADTISTDTAREKLVRYQESVDANLKAKAIWNNARETLEYLYARWQDEKEYENIHDYAGPLKETVEAGGGTIIRMTSRPFACHFAVGHYSYAISCNARSTNIKGFGRNR